MPRPTTQALGESGRLAALGVYGLLLILVAAGENTTLEMLSSYSPSKDPETIRDAVQQLFDLGIIPQIVAAAAELRHAETLLGPGTVVRAQEAGGRDILERLRLLPWDAADRPGQTGPWPGGLTGPPPALTVAEPVRILDPARLPVTCDARGAVSSAPAFLVDGAGARPVDHRRGRGRGRSRSAGGTGPVIAATPACRSS